MQLLRKYLKEIDWIFLCFLLIFLNQSTFSLKAAGILFIYIARPNFKIRLIKGHIPKFYWLIIACAVVNFFLVRDFSRAYLVAFMLASVFWVMSILAFHQINLFIKRNGEGSISTLKAFTIANLVVSVYQLVKIMLITGRFNPYKDLDFPYGLSTGDNIYGVLLQNSLLNMMICSLLAIYFLYKKNMLFSMLALIPFVLVFSNTGTLIFIVVLFLIFISDLLHGLLRGSKMHGSQNRLARILPGDGSYLRIPVLVLFIICLSAIISPENIRYTVHSIWTKVHQDVSETDKRKLEELEAQSAVIKGRPANVQQRTGAGMPIVKTGYEQLLEEKENLSRDYLYHFKGKKLSFVETGELLKSSPLKLLFGAGPVRFSSLTAQRMCGFDSSRLFMKVLPHFQSNLYSENHMLLIKVRRESGPEYRSSINWPDSFYNQIFGEYGVLGFLLFIIFYIGFFARKIDKWSYGFWLSLLAVSFALFSYLFESFSVIIIFELLMQLDIKQNNAEHVTAGNGLNAGV